MFFFKKIIPGGSAHSFGIHVAKMAGMPKGILILLKKVKSLEDSHSSGKKVLQEKTDSDLQLSFFNLDDPIGRSYKREI